MTIKKFLPIAISIAIMIMGIFFFVVNDKENNEGLNTQEAAITSLKNKISVMEAANDTGATDSKAKTAGLDSNRVESGTKAFGDALDVMTNWNSKDTYVSARKALQSTYGVEETSDLLTKLLPENGKFDIGPSVDDIDKGFSMSIKESQSYVIGIVGSEYEYLAQVVFIVKNVDGSTAESPAVFTYKVSGDNITNLEFIGFN